MTTPSHPALAKIIQDFLVERYYVPAKGKTPPNFPIRFFEDGVEELNRSFTSERGGLHRNYFNKKELRSGYIAYFLPVNALKVPALLKEVPAAFWQRDKLKVLDLGSGPGTGVLGTMLHIARLTGPVSGVPSTVPPSTLQVGVTAEGRPHSPPVHLHCTAIDQNPEILKDARALHHKMAESLKLNSKLETRTADLVHDPIAKILHHEKYDLILILNTFNELFTMERRVQILKRLTTAHLNEGGLILIMEPALRKTTRELMELHDAMLKRTGPVSGGQAGTLVPVAQGTGAADTKSLSAEGRPHSPPVLHILAPCLHQCTCPMLKESDRDWCHTYIEWERPQLIEEFDKRVGIRKDYLMCSYLLLTNASPSPQPSPQRERGNMWRAVSSLMRENGKAKLVLCGEASAKKGKLLHTERLNKDRSEANYLFDQIKRGDVVGIAPKERIEKRDVITK